MSSVGERRWPGAGGEATPGPGRGHGTEEPATARPPRNTRGLGDTCLGGGVTICGQCVLGYLGLGDAGPGDAGTVWRGWWRAVVTTAPMWSVAVSGTGHVTRPGVAAPCHTVTSVASRPATAAQ